MIGIMNWIWAWADQPYQLIQVRLGRNKIKESSSQYPHWYKERAEYQHRYTHLWFTNSSIFAESYKKRFSDKVKVEGSPDTRMCISCQRA